MDRIEFLKNRFNVITNDEMKEKFDLMKEDMNFEVNKIDHSVTSADGFTDKKFYFISYRDNSKKRPKYKYFLQEDLFNNVLDADPSKNQMYTQWILDLMLHLPIKRDNETDEFNEEGVNSFTRFIFEDLPKTTENLVLFEENKRKKRFKDACAANFGVKEIEDPTNINQYTSFEQLYAAVFPFKENLNPSDLEKKLREYVKLGQAEMPVQDEHYTVFIPLTLAASEIFSFTNWCTGSKNNGMFKNYTLEGDNRRADGKPSKLVVIIDNGVFTGQNENLYQMHVETDQLRDTADKIFTKFKEQCLVKSLSLRNFMRSYLGEGYKIALNKSMKKHEKNYYGKIVEFGMCEILFDIIESDAINIRFRQVGIDKMPSLSRFRRLKFLYLDKVGLKNLSLDLFESEHLQLVSLPFNQITELPDNIGNAKNLIFLNIAGNPIKSIPQSIQFLDITKGGNLKKVSLNEDNAYLAPQLKEYLPSIEIMGL